MFKKIMFKKIMFKKVLFKKIKFIQTQSQHYFPGIVTVALVSGAAYSLALALEFSAVIIAIVLGLIVRSISILPSSTLPGIKWGSTTLLNMAIIGLGASLNVAALSQLGIQSIVFVVIIVIVLLALAYLIARLFQLSKNYSFLLAMGNGICGSAAIAGSAPLIKASNEEVGLTVAVINLVGTLGLFGLPVLAVLIFPDQVYTQSLLLGLGLPAVGQVAAAGFLVTEDVGQLATVVKMARILLLGPFLLITALIINQSIENKNQGINFIPGFIIGFLLLATLTNLNVFGEKILASIQILSKILLIAAMSSIGLSIAFKDMIKVSATVLVAGTVIFLAHILVLSLVLLLVFSS